jgi:hypothetical protein
LVAPLLVALPTAGSGSEAAGLAAGSGTKQKYSFLYSLRDLKNNKTYVNEKRKQTQNN